MHDLSVPDSYFRLRVDGATGAVRWARRYPGYEMHASPAVGTFTFAFTQPSGAGVDADAPPGAVFALHRGVFPVYETDALVVWVDHHGNEIWRLALATHIISSPVVGDFNQVRLIKPPLPSPVISPPPRASPNRTWV